MSLNDDLEKLIGTVVEEADKNDEPLCRTIHPYVDAAIDQVSADDFGSAEVLTHEQEQIAACVATETEMLLVDLLMYAPQEFVENEGFHGLIRTAIKLAFIVQQNYERAQR